MSRLLIVFITALFYLVEGYGGENVEALIGKRLCHVAFDKNFGYSIDLDKGTNRQLLVKKRRGMPLLMVIQYSDGEDKCGLVRDAVIAYSSRHQFEFNCRDIKRPSAVVLGEIRSANTWGHRRALRAWDIDVESAQLKTTYSQVTCYNESYSGLDVGDDLVTWSKKRITDAQ